MTERTGKEECPAARYVDEGSFLSQRKPGCDRKGEAEGLDEQHPRAEKLVEDVATEDL